MKNVNITDIREKLSEYIRYVLSGGTVVLWRHEKRVAKIIPDYASAPGLDDSEFSAQIASGVMQPPESYVGKNFFGKIGEAPVVASAELSRIVIEDRADRI